MLDSAADLARARVAALSRTREVRDDRPFNVVVLQEDVARGERVDGWELVADGRVISSGKSIGIKRIRVLESPVRASKVDVRVTSGPGDAGSVSCRRYSVVPELLDAVMKSTTDSGETDTAKWMSVGKED